MAIDRGRTLLTGLTFVFRLLANVAAQLGVGAIPRALQGGDIALNAGKEFGRRGIGEKRGRQVAGRLSGEIAVELSFEAAQASFSAGKGDALGLLDSARSYLQVRLEDARAIARLARERGWSSIVVVTSRFHVTRARMLFRRCYRGALSVVPVGSTAFVSHA